MKSLFSFFNWPWVETWIEAQQRPNTVSPAIGLVTIAIRSTPPRLLCCTPTPTCARPPFQTRATPRRPHWPRSPVAQHHQSKGNPRNQVHEELITKKDSPHFLFLPNYREISLIRDKIVRTPRIRSGARSLINSGRCPLSFCCKDQTLGTTPQHRLRRFTTSHAQWRLGKASLAASTTVGSQNRTEASSRELAVDQE
jgi:hypothetical protein